MSSGTTGEPKCIERTWEEIEVEIEHYNKLLPVEADTIPFIACPITHSYGLISGVLSAFQRGVQPRILASTNPKYVLKMLSEKPGIYSMHHQPCYKRCFNFSQMVKHFIM